MGGRIFIDRDGKHFRLVLNYLRDGPEVVVGVATSVLKELRREANFYQLTSLVNAIDAELAAKKSSYAVVYLGGYGASAKVYTEGFLLGFVVFLMSSIETQGGFSTSCATLNELCTKGFVLEGVLSGSPGQYYAIGRQEQGGQGKPGN